MSMYLRKTVHLFCDAVGCTSEDELPMAANGSFTSAKNTARQYGWRIAKDETLCPECNPRSTGDQERAFIKRQNEKK